MSKKLTFLIVTVIISVALFTFILPQIKASGFSDYIKQCSSTSPEIRFSCFRSGIEKYYKGDFSGFVKRLQEKEKVLAGRSEEYAIFGTNSHTFYHAAGDFIAENSTLDDIKTLIDLCPKTSTSGCMMGLYKRLALKHGFPDDLLYDFYKYCRDDEKDSCSHEIGHILHDKYTYSILKILDEVSNSKYGLKPKTNYQYTTLKNYDLSAPFEDCRTIIPKEEKGKQDRCYTGVGHNLFLFSEFSKDGYKSMFEECSKIKESDKDKCFAFLIFRIGINEAAPRFLSENYQEGNKVCDESVTLANRKDLISHCFVGIGGGIGLYIDSEYGDLDISEKNILEVKKQLLKWAKLCDNIKIGFQDHCYGGLMGTKFKKLYFQLDMYDPKIEKILPRIDKDFVIVG